MARHDLHGRAQIHLHPAAATGHADPAPEADDPGLGHTVRALLSVVRRRRRLVLGVWLGVLLPALAYALTAVPTYTSHGAVQVSDGGALGGANPLMELVGGGSQAEVQTEVEIIRRREFLLDVLRSLRLQVVDPDEASLVTLDMGVALGGRSPVDPRLRAVRGALSELHVHPRDFRPVPLRLTMEADGAFRVAVDGELMERYAGRIFVSALGAARHPTNIVRISVTDTDRDTARRIAQTMMDHYLDKTLEWQSKSASQAAGFIEGQLEDVKDNLLAAEGRLRDYSQQENAIQLDTQAKVAIEQAAELEARRVTLQMQEKAIGAVLARLAGKGQDRASLTANFFEDPVLTAAVGALTEAETRYATMRGSLTADHPSVRELGRALELQRAEVARLLKSARRNLSQQRNQIERELAASQDAMRDYPDKQIELARLMRDLEVSQRLYTMLLEKHEEAEIVKASTTTDKRVVDVAGVPHKPASPRRVGLLAFANLGGLLLGMVAALGAHLLRSRLDTVEAVREAVPFPVYGTVPMVGAGDREAATRLDVRAVWARPHEPAPEAFRALGVGVSLLPAEAGRGRIIMVTSSQPGEGKSTIASNLAVSLSRAGKRVLLLDLDLRKPVQHRIWQIARAPGYSDLLGRGAGADDLERFSACIEEFDTRVMPAGTRLPDTVSAIMTPALGEMLRAWSAQFDVVVVDSPPAFVAETAAVARHADLLLLVVRPGQIERGALRGALENLARADVAKGLVLNAVARQHTDDYYGSGYYYYAQSYAETAGKADEKVA